MQIEKCPLEGVLVLKPKVFKDGRGFFFESFNKKDFESITGNNQVIPTEYALHPAYPNPFNPTPNIKYSLPTDTKVIFEVYNIKGKLINTLYSGKK